VSYPHLLLEYISLCYNWEEFLVSRTEALEIAVEPGILV
jgi:hypothetical protein